MTEAELARKLGERIVEPMNVTLNWTLNLYVEPRDQQTLGWLIERARVQGVAAMKDHILCADIGLIDHAVLRVEPANNDKEETNDD